MCFQFIARDRDDRQFVVGIGKAAAVARHMLHHRQHPAGLQPLGRGTPHIGDGFRIAAIGAVADDAAAAFDRHVENRQAIDIDAEFEKIEGVQPRHQPCRAQPLLAIAPVDIPERLAGGIVLQDRRADALHAATFLINQHRRVPADAFAHFGDEIGDLLRV